MEKKIAIIVGNFFFPDRNAAGKYNLPYGLILKELGYKVVFIGTDDRIDFKSDIFETYMRYNEMDSYSMPHPKSIFDWLKYKKQINRFLKIVEKYGVENISLVITFGNPAISLWVKEIIDWTKKNNIKVISHAPENVRFTKRNLLYALFRGIDDYLNKKVFILKSDAIIVGGPLLKKYYENKKCLTGVFPTMVNENENINTIKKIIFEKYKEKNKNYTSFVYAGIPFDLKGKDKRKNFKDRLDKTIELFNEIYSFNNKFIFNIYGIEKKDYLLKVPEHEKILEKLRDNIIFHGKIPPEEVKRKIIESDFYIFHRDKTRITEAAFPTKASEPISLGTPLITNDTSYIFEYIRDNDIGFKINDDNQVKKILDLMNLSKDKIMEIKLKCLNEQIFYYKNFIDKLKSII